MGTENIKERIREKAGIRMNRLFRRALATVEQQSKDFAVKNEFFAKDNKKGFGLIRKTVLDNGNELLEYIDGVLDLLNIEPAKASIEIPEKVMREIENDTAGGDKGSRRPKGPKDISGTGLQIKKGGNKS